VYVIFIQAAPAPVRPEVIADQHEAITSKICLFVSEWFRVCC
jgi:hypothetical protein